MAINEKPEKDVPVPRSIRELMASKAENWSGHRKQAEAMRGCRPLTGMSYTRLKYYLEK